MEIINEEFKFSIYLGISILTKHIFLTFIGISYFIAFTYFSIYFCTRSMPNLSTRRITKTTSLARKSYEYDVPIPLQVFFYNPVRAACASAIFPPKERSQLINLHSSVCNMPANNVLSQASTIHSELKCCSRAENPMIVSLSSLVRRAE